MNALFARLAPHLVRLYRRSGWVLLAAGSLSLLGAYYGLRLRIDTDLANLLPRETPSVLALERLRQTLGAESKVQVIIQSPSFAANLAFAQSLIEAARSLRDTVTGEPFFRRIDFERDPGPLRTKALYLATEQELEALKRFLEREAERARLRANPFFFELEEEPDSAEQAVWMRERSLLQDAYNTILPKRYPISEDSTVMIVELVPVGSEIDVGYVRRLYERLERLVGELRPARYHPQMHVELGGRMRRRLFELEAVTHDVFSSFAAGFSSVLALLAGYFWLKAARARIRAGFSKRRAYLEELLRVPVPLLLIGLPLLMGLSWTFGLAWWLFGKLNLMTAVLFVILFGMGIDYGIHAYARYIELRTRGDDVFGALEHLIRWVGPAIATSALTTAASLYVLVFARFRGFSEFGFIAGTGVLFALVGALLILPALLVWAERFRLVHLPPAVTPPKRAASPAGRFPAPRFVLGLGFGLSAICLAALPRLGFEYDFGRLEPEFPEYAHLRELEVRVFGLVQKRNPAYVITASPEDAAAVAAELRRRMAADTSSPTILSVEALAERLPVDPETQRRKLALLAEIRTLLEDPFLRGAQGEEQALLDRLREAAQVDRPLRVEEVPDYLKQLFLTREGTLGNFVVIYPAVGLSDARNSIAFKEDVGRIALPNGKVYYAASSSIVAADMIELMQAEAPYMVGATLGVIVLLMWMTFGSLGWTFIALLPLLVGFGWLFGLMGLAGVLLNLYNITVLPAVLGIGEDNGVHITHRYQEEGPGGLFRVLRSTGQHITIGSATTMLGFGGLFTTFHPGLWSMGFVAFWGVGLTLLSALLLLPALLQYLEDTGRLPRKGWHVGGSIPEGQALRPDGLRS
ncbi:MAG: MMPL family transporter [Bacteroidetes bacterium]|nr:MMPL family transporter [Rhodothermia bacterium]MCS7154707.1 MMPL family transporter [Bacteroidota bacterium]MCX7907136.1 MMPL family transporter [Bacteroidota bacterium]MDW8137500.1 MMPL family transporter [Bacteroidota bacterium]MDW8285546.1 MMPL family transporter [Bacteroidota bacterium]